ncbi:MAG: 5-methyltetrahydrofolate--homocysteine methyltransferase [Clostridiales bacterium 38_11]|nr:MAG: 5-methyltetrahydrofolate--homocysteine methyltransferase [Clostridiales bacterium 38_11]HBH12743.1 homocysteine methyltransferase [Clostridiales bacterium]
MISFAEFSKKNIVLFDGAIGTEIQKKIPNTGLHPEVLNLTEPELIRSIHKDYSEAGAHVLSTNTFGANDYKLKNSGFSIEKIISSGVGLTKEFQGCYSALDLGPTGVLINNNTEYHFEYFYNLFKKQVIVGENSGCDLILIETMTDIYEAKAAILAAKENTKLPIICSMTLQKNGRTLTGSDVLTIVSVLESLGVDAIGLNCSFGPAEMRPFIEEMVKYSSSNLLIQPNAGLPKIINGATYFDLTPDAFTKQLMKIRDLGVNMLGGCCGTTPQHIATLRASLSDIKPKVVNEKNYTFVSSSTKTVIIDNIKIIGERINPTGKKALKEAIISEDMDYIVSLALAQEIEGADILDVNAGVPGIDESKAMQNMIREITKSSSLPIQIDSSDSRVIENALRSYNGKALVNSVNGKQDSLNKVLPLIQKYGGCIIGLTMDDKGIPSESTERFKIASKIVDQAGELGIKRKNIIIDCLTLTASAQQKDVFETLYAIRDVKEKLGVKTCLGVSNVSFGLPQRDTLTSTFLISALTMGLDVPIMNTLSEKSMDAIRAFRVLKGIDKDSEQYIDHFRGTTATGIKETSSEKKKAEEASLSDCIVKARKNEAIMLTKKLLETMSKLEIINLYIAPALDLVGDKYEKGDIFLPQLLNSAETVQGVFEVIKNSATHESTADKNKKIILATVEGDVHDIGKNIVKMLLENYGFYVIDLGKNVNADVIVDCAKAEDVRLIGLSALMTTTVANMKKTIEVLKSNFPDVTIMVGGAVLNDDYARNIGSNHYGKDAMEAVSIAKKYFAEKEIRKNEA